MFAPLACIYVYEANRLWTTAYSTFGRYMYIYMYTFATFAFSDMCIEIIILGYKDLEFDFPLKGQLKCGMFYLLQDVCNCNYISE